MFVTQVPKADPNYYCSQKLKPEERTFWAIFSRAMSVLVGLGLKINGRHTLCGDYIYSGHTIVHVTCYLFIRECKSRKQLFIVFPFLPESLDSPRRWFLLHAAAFLAALLGVLSLLFSRGHYSIDVILAYWITTRVFWIYHTLADLPALRVISLYPFFYFGCNFQNDLQGRNHLIKVVWYPLFTWMEGSVQRPIPQR